MKPKKINVELVLPARVLDTYKKVAKRVGITPAQAMELVIALSVEKTYRMGKK